ncbi:MAG: hypothetical protein E7311_00510 [Clostridiales bacterium]|nr:hypothetical protein [Clostridiales bacterium]
MKKILIFILNLILIFSMCCNSFVYATNINGMTEEEIIQKYEQIKKERALLKKSRDSKFDIIRNNNIKIQELKAQALSSIQSASNKVDKLLEQIKRNEVVITQDLLNQLTSMLNLLQTSNATIANEANQLQEIVKMVKIKGYDSSVLTVLDSAIEKQNAIIVSYKQIIETLNNL